MEKVAISRRQLGGESPMVVSRIAPLTVYSGLFGTLDSARMQNVTDQITDYCTAQNARYAIVDLGNVDAIDSAVAQHIINMAKAAKLCGIEMIFCGIQGRVARVMVGASLDVGVFETHSDLEIALQATYRKTGRRLVNQSKDIEY